MRKLNVARNDSIQHDERSLSTSLNHTHKVYTTKPKDIEEFRIRTQSQASRKRGKLRTPSVNKHRTSQHEFKVPFSIYDTQTPAVNQLYTQQQFFPRGQQSRAESRQQSLKKKKLTTNIEQSRSRDRSLKSSRSVRSQRITTPQKNLNYLNQQSQQNVHQTKKIKRKKFLINSQTNQSFNKSTSQNNQELLISNYSNFKIDEEQSQQENTFISQNPPNYQHDKGQIEQNKNQESKHESPIKKLQPKRLLKQHHSPLTRQPSPNAKLQDHPYQHPPTTSFKKILEEQTQEYTSLRQQLQFMEDDQQKKKQQIEKLKIKTAQAQSDKIELMRDLATYECNFSENSGIRSTLLQLYRKVDEVKKQVKTQEQNDQIKTVNQWLDKTIISDLHSHLQELSLLKRDRGSLSDLNAQECIFTPKSLKQMAETSKGFRQLYQNRNKKLASRINDQFSNYDDQEFKSMKISGIHCSVQVNIINSNINVVVTTSQSNKSYSLEIKPIITKNKISIKKELTRLYFAIDTNPTPPPQQQQPMINSLNLLNVPTPTHLSVSNKSQAYRYAQLPLPFQITPQITPTNLILCANDDYFTNERIFLIKLKGSKQKLCQVEIIDTTEDDEEDQVIAKIQVRDKDYQVKLDREVDGKKRSNEQLVRIIEERYVMRQRKDGEYEIVELTAVENEGIQSARWMRKIEKAQELDDQTEEDEFQTLNQREVSKNQEEDQDEQSANQKGLINNSSISNNIKTEKLRMKDRIDIENVDQSSFQKGYEDLSSIKDVDSVSVHSEDNLKNIQSQTCKNLNENNKANQQLTFSGYHHEFMNLQNASKINKHQSQIFDQDGFLRELQLEVLNSSSKNKQSVDQQLKQISLNMTHRDNSKTTQKSSKKKSELTLEDQQLKYYEFYYHYVWFINNRQYYNLFQERFREEERKRQMEYELQMQLQRRSEESHDREQIDKIKADLDVYRVYFKGPVSIMEKQSELIGQTDFMIDEKSQVQLYFYDEGDFIQVVINEVNSGDGITSGDGQSQRGEFNFKCLDSLEITQGFVERLNLYMYKSLEIVKDKISEFAQFDVLHEIIKHQIKYNQQNMMNENKQIYKTFDRTNTIGQLYAPPIRKMESEIHRNTIRSFADNRTISEFGDTSLNESYSKYFK